jgi:hypothetical protein
MTLATGKDAIGQELSGLNTAEMPVCEVDEAWKTCDFDRRGAQ